MTAAEISLIHNLIVIRFHIELFNPAFNPLNITYLDPLQLEDEHFYAQL